MGGCSLYHNLHDSHTQVCNLHLDEILACYNLACCNYSLSGLIGYCHYLILVYNCFYLAFGQMDFWKSIHLAMALLNLICHHQKPRRLPD